MPRQCITAKHYPKFWKCSNYQKHTYRTKFFKRNFSVAIAVSMDDGFIDYLLQLCIFQVAANHHFEHLEQLTVWDVTVFVHVVDFKSDWKQGWNIKVSISSAYSSCSPYQICHKNVSQRVEIHSRLQTHNWPIDTIWKHLLCQPIAQHRFYI